MFISGIDRHEKLITISLPLTSPTGRICIPYKRWTERYENKLKILDNGFVVFLPGIFAVENITV